MNLPPSIQLITASLDLQLVRLIRGAMNANGPANGPGIGVSGPGGGGLTPGPKLGASQAASRGPVTVTPEPRFEPRPVHTPEPRELPPHRIETDCPLKAGGLWGPLPAPWQMSLQEQLCHADAPAAVPELKFLTRGVDLTDSGRMLDQFA